MEDSKHKIFSRRPFSSPLRLNAGLTARPEALHTPAAGAATTALLDSRREAERLLLDQFAPAALVVDPKLQIIHFQGNTSPYPAPGDRGTELSPVEDGGTGVCGGSPDGDSPGKERMVQKYAERFGSRRTGHWWQLRSV